MKAENTVRNSGEGVEEGRRIAIGSTTSPSFGRGALCDVQFSPAALHFHKSSALET
jgi:hypothetical protein